MLEGVSIEISLYYRDGGGNKVTVAATSITNTPGTFPTNTHFVDFQVRVPVVKPGDAWAGKNLGVRFLSTAGSAQQGGYWDLDNVRLSSTVEPPFALSAAPEGTSLRISWPSASGYQYQMEKSADLQTWSNYEAAMSGTGGELFKIIPLAGQSGGNFRVKVSTVP